MGSRLFEYATEDNGAVTVCGINFDIYDGKAELWENFDNVGGCIDVRILF
jgi:hypothetical protein